MECQNKCLDWLVFMLISRCLHGEMRLKTDVFLVECDAQQKHMTWYGETFGLLNSGNGKHSILPGKHGQRGGTPIICSGGLCCLDMDSQAKWRPWNFLKWITEHHGVKSRSLGLARITWYASFSVFRTCRVGSFSMFSEMFPEMFIAMWRFPDMGYLQILNVNGLLGL